jgi:hypothetical protein
VVKLKLLLRKSYVSQCDVVDCGGISVSQITTDMLLCCCVTDDHRYVTLSLFHSVGLLHINIMFAIAKLKPSHLSYSVVLNQHHCQFICIYQGISRSTCTLYRHFYGYELCSASHRFDSLYVRSILHQEKKCALDSQPQVIKFTSCLPMIG